MPTITIEDLKVQLAINADLDFIVDTNIFKRYAFGYGLRV